MASTSLPLVADGIQVIGHKTVMGIQATIYSMGVAEGAICKHYPSHSVNVWPKHEHFRVFSGGERKWRDVNFGKLRFQQEIYVYLREFGYQVNQAIETLKVKLEGEDFWTRTCLYCKKDYGTAFRQKRYCSRSCLLKDKAWKYTKDSNTRLREELAGLRPKISKEGNWWRIRGFGTDGTYTKIRKRFATFEQAAQFLAEVNAA